MSGDSFGDELLVRVRDARPGFDGSELSASGEHAREVLIGALSVARDPVIGPGRRPRSGERSEERLAFRRRVIALGLAGAAAAGVAAVVATVAVPSVIGGGSGGAVAPTGVRADQPVALAAVPSRVFASLSTNAGDVLRIAVTPTGGTSGDCPVTRWVYPFDAAAGQAVRMLIEASPSCGARFAKTIDIPNAQPLIVGSGPGQPLDAEGLYMTGAGTVRTFDAATNTQTQVDASDLEVTAGPVPEITRRQLTAGTLRLVGHPIVDGRSTLELSVQGSQLGAFTLWVDATSYLPVREYLPSSGIQEDFTFLPATDANLAHLQFPAAAASASGTRG